MNKRRVLELKFRDYLKERTTERQVKTYVGSELEGLVTGFLLTQVNGDESKHEIALHKQSVSEPKGTVCLVKNCVQHTFDNKCEKGNDYYCMYRQTER